MERQIGEKYSFDLQLLELRSNLEKQKICFLYIREPEILRKSIREVYKRALFVGWPFIFDL
jgi:hypothetical protein